MGYGPLVSLIFGSETASNAQSKIWNFNIDRESPLHRNLCNFPCLPHSLTLRTITKASWGAGNSYAETWNLGESGEGVSPRERFHVGANKYVEVVLAFGSAIR